MQKTYKNIDELLADSYFIEWLCDPTEESDNYWSDLASKDVQLKALIPLAKKSFLNISVETESIDPAIKKSVLQNIQRGRKIRNFNPTTLLKIAAVFLCVCAVAVYLILPQNDFTTEFGSTMSIDLEDGTQVVLNANSHLRVDTKNLDKSSREVWMEGEAYFNVVSKPSNTFTVHTSRGDITVLGTRFNIEDTKETFSVYLEEGKVKFTPNQEYLAESIDLDVKKRLIFSESSNDFQVQDNKDPNIVAWKEHKIICEEMPLSELSKEIETYYGVDIAFKQKALADRKLTGTLENQSLEELLFIISEAMSLNIHSNEGSIEFSYD